MRKRCSLRSQDQRIRGRQKAEAEAAAEAEAKAEAVICYYYYYYHRAGHRRPSSRVVGWQLPNGVRTNGAFAEVSQYTVIDVRHFLKTKLTHCMKISMAKL